ncbi:MAG: GNAT family N-acetyltransferase [Anaerolineae bacterium]|nr:GNAT family N-acetyltransferase [Anaerolineae bacterium]
MLTDVTEFLSVQAGWRAYLDHLERAKMLTSATDRGEPKADCAYLGVTVEMAVVGHLSLRRQPICVPVSSLNAAELHVMDRTGTLLYEAFVQSFAVEPGYRRQGYGRALQQAALLKASKWDCYQLRSWSSADKRENYALKISLGFAIQPALYPMPGGAPISGVYFVKRTSRD